MSSNVATRVRPHAYYMSNYDPEDLVQINLDFLGLPIHTRLEGDDFVASGSKGDGEVRLPISRARGNYRDYVEPLLYERAIEKLLRA
jgi:hypothetical protein